MLETYLKLEQMRFGKSFQYQIEGEAALEDLRIPAMVIQPFLENAIKHNRIDEESPLKISFKTENGFLTVSNNRNPKRPEYTAKTGLANIRKRYEYLTDKAVLVSEKPDSFTVSVPLIANA